MASNDLIKQVLFVQKLQRERSQGMGPNIEERIAMLDKMKALLVENEAQWLEALRKDLFKPQLEAYSSELAVLLNEIDYARKYLRSWMKPKTKRRILFTGIEKTKTTFQPYASILVISPWNYPLQLALMPVIGALAAGNGVVLKPSEFTPSVSHLLADLIPRYFEKDTLIVVQGDAGVAKMLTDLPWDFIVFTGSSETGRKVYEAAARNLTPALLELGGKNPCVLDVGSLSKENIRKIVWGKFLNAGQSCIAPDTLYVPKEIYPKALEMIKEVVIEFYGEAPENSESFGRMIHAKHLEKVSSFLKEVAVYHGGHVLENERYIEPTILVDIDPNQSVLKEEIFGPILPVIPYDAISHLIKTLKEHPTPLVSYLFSNNATWLKKMGTAWESGSVSVNEVIIHAASPNISFGGKGQSGLGRYHGEHSFKTFTYEKSFYSRVSPVSYSAQSPPYTDKALTILRRIRRKLF